MKYCFLIARISAIILLTIANSIDLFGQYEEDHGRVIVSPNGHFLQYRDGTPFFWLGDTGWELFSRLNKQEIEQYLENRRKKGFNVIQAILIGPADNPLRPNQYGNPPVNDKDPAKPNEEYFQLVDWAIQVAKSKGLFLALLPTWGDKVSKFWGTGEVLFNEDNAYAYGLFLGARYKDKSNVIWIAGGDRPAFDNGSDWRNIWRQMIRGIREGTKQNALITYHPWGEHSSTEFWHNDTTLDFNMMQSGHKRHDVEVWDWTVRDFNEMPPKPILDGEPVYEDHPINWKIENGYFRDYDVRKQLYRSVFSGGCGVTYGHQAVWQFYSPRESKIVYPDRYWTKALDRPGAFQAGYLKQLILSRPSLRRVTDETLVISGYGQGAKRIVSFRDSSRSYLMIYITDGREITVNLHSLLAQECIAWWFNPRSGKAIKIGQFKNETRKNFVPPTKGIGNDWVLVVDNVDKGYPTPGSFLPIHTKKKRICKD